MYYNYLYGRGLRKNLIWVFKRKRNDSKLFCPKGRGKTEPGERMKKISEALEVPADYFLGLTDTYWIDKNLRKFYGGFYFTA